MRVRALCTWLTAATTALSILAAGVMVTAPSSTQAGADELPLRLVDTGLFAPGTDGVVAPGVWSFTPQFPLWADGAAKRRWLYLPPGRAIDASDPDAWVFPPGTRLWKEFAHEGRRVETRYLERRADGRWRYATYVWTADGREALRPPDEGLPGLAVAGAPEGRYDVPGREDCLACHESAAAPVLGLSALQLSPQRDGLPAAPGDVDLPTLVARGLLVGLPQRLLQEPPHIAAASDAERAALGYLHGNCGHCHNDNGQPPPVRLRLAQRVLDPAAARAEVLDTVAGARSRYRPRGLAQDARIAVPGHPEDSVLALRMRSRHAQVQMPPLGTRVPDSEGLALVERWIARDLQATPALAMTASATASTTASTAVSSTASTTPATRR